MFFKRHLTTELRVLPLYVTIHIGTEFNIFRL